AWWLVLADASLGQTTGAYEARFSLRINGVIEPTTYPYVNIYTDSGDGTDKSVSLTWLVNLPLSAPEFALMVARQSGAGIVKVQDRVHTVLGPFDIAPLPTSTPTPTGTPTATGPPPTNGQIFLPLVRR